ncbi:MAG: hypothetical protein ABJB40_04550 [Acidobacteriota bacterium]
MKRKLFIVFIGFLLAGSAFAQKSKPWTEWSKKDADKVLNDSPWAQTQVKGEARPDTSIGAIAKGSGRVPENKDQSGDTLSSEIRLRIRFITARPIREGFARRILLAKQDPPKELQDQVQAFIDRDFGDRIVIGLNADGENPRVVSGMLKGLAKLTTASFSDKVFLERKDRKRLPLIEYRPPTDDGMGGKFIFARSLEGSPFLSGDSESVRFIVNMTDSLKLDVKFKVSAMMYGEKLEY